MVKFDRLSWGGESVFFLFIVVMFVRNVIVIVVVMNIVCVWVCVREREKESESVCLLRIGV